MALRLHPFVMLIGIIINRSNIAMLKGEITMKNKKLLKYFTEKILPILDKIEFNDKEHVSVLLQDV